MRVKVGGCWRWPRSMMAAPGPGQRGLAALGCRPFGTGLCGSTSAGRVAAIGMIYEWAPFRGSLRNRLDQAVARQSRFFAAGRPHRRYTAILAIAWAKSRLANGF